MHDEDHRQLVLEDLGHLAEDLLALGLGADLARAVEQRIELRWEMPDQLNEVPGVVLKN